MKHPNKRGPSPILNRERREALLHLRFKKRWKQVTLAIHFHIAQSTVARYIARAS